ncbi:MAG TPA: cytochrome c maturation protein CcmE [Terriglobales bacterium]|nr:cytochrome c maturation protein CcmE [Terriglobales bacterium]
MRNRYFRFGLVIVVIVVSLGYLAYTGVQESKSYYVTIKELKADKDPYHKRLRVAGTVLPGSIKRTGSHVEFTLQEENHTLPVVYNGSEAPPDTFHDSSQALAEGTYGRDGVFHAKQLQAKCASKYAPQQQPQGAPATPSPTTTQTSQAATPALDRN